LEMVSQKLFPRDWLQAMILPISISHVARITGVSHQYLAIYLVSYIYQYLLCCHSGTLELTLGSKRYGKLRHHPAY
jgi:hypothetical protein